VQKRTKAILVATVVLAGLVFFFCAPVVYYNPPNNAGNITGYESPSCVVFNIGLSYGSPSLLANYWTFLLRCGNIAQNPLW
jgi:hypothetical protein